MYFYNIKFNIKNKNKLFYSKFLNEFLGHEFFTQNLTHLLSDNLRFFNGGSSPVGLTPITFCNNLMLACCLTGWLSSVVTLLCLNVDLRSSNCFLAIASVLAVATFSA